MALSCEAYTSLRIQTVQWAFAQYSWNQGAQALLWCVGIFRQGALVGQAHIVYCSSAQKSNKGAALDNHAVGEAGVSRA